MTIEQEIETTPLPLKEKWQRDIESTLRKIYAMGKYPKKTLSDDDIIHVLDIKAYDIGTLFEEFEKSFKEKNVVIVNEKGWHNYKCIWITPPGITTFKDHLYTCDRDGMNSYTYDSILGKDHPKYYLHCRYALVESK